MKRYSQQTDSYRCGPVALRNALITQGQYYSVAYLARLVKCKRPNGTFSKILIRSAKNLGLNLIKVPSKSLDQKGEFIVNMVIEWPGWRGEKTCRHYVYVNKGRVYNLGAGSISQKLNWITRAALLYKNTEKGAPIVWRIKRD